MPRSIPQPILHTNNPPLADLQASASQFDQLITLLITTPILLALLLSPLPIRPTTSVCFFVSAAALLLHLYTHPFANSLAEDHAVALLCLTGALVPLVIGTFLDGYQTGARAWALRCAAGIEFAGFLLLVALRVEDDETGRWAWVDWKADHLQIQAAIFAFVQLRDLLALMLAPEGASKVAVEVVDEESKVAIVVDDERDWVRGFELQTVAELPGIQAWRSMS